jgi:hypothetical protein
MTLNSIEPAIVPETDFTFPVVVIPLLTREDDSFLRADKGISM